MYNVCDVKLDHDHAVKNESLILLKQNLCAYVYNIWWQILHDTHVLIDFEIQAS